jgi:hypothetical protein
MSSEKAPEWIRLLTEGLDWQEISRMYSTSKKRRLSVGELIRLAISTHDRAIRGKRQAKAPTQPEAQP